LNLPDANWSGLRFTDVRHYVALALEAHHEQSNDAVVLELLAHGADEDGAHRNLPKEKNQSFGFCRSGNYSQKPESAEIIYRWRTILRLLS
jgi:hypothetical protein